MLSQNYYLRVVPTVYTNSTEDIVSNQFSVNEVQRNVEMSAFGQISSLPGIFFIYDITPFMHIITEKSMSFAHFLVRICAVIGGVAAVRLLDVCDVDCPTRGYHHVLSCKVVKAALVLCVCSNNVNIPPLIIQVRLIVRLSMFVFLLQ